MTKIIVPGEANPTTSLESRVEALESTVDTLVHVLMSKLSLPGEEELGAVNALIYEGAKGPFDMEVWKDLPLFEALTYIAVHMPGKE